MHNKPHTQESREKIRKSHIGIPLPWKRRETKIVNGETLYICGTCKQFKSRDGFYKNKRTLLGITSQCKTCHTECTIQTRDKDKKRISNRNFMRRHRAANLEIYRERDREASRRRPKNEKTKARAMLNAVVRRGEIIRPDHCSRCGSVEKVTAHHNDYSKPLDVEWLCYVCHGNK